MKKTNRKYKGLEECLDYSVYNAVYEKFNITTGKVIGPSKQQTTMVFPIFYHHYIYFLKCDDGKNKRIKIGVSAKPEYRLSDLRTAMGNSVYFLGIIKGPRELETELHKYFNELHIEREFFKDTPKLRSFIKKYATTDRKALHNPTGIFTKIKLWKGL